jgi:DNA-binding LytR/AlgR family response regulator
MGKIITVKNEKEVRNIDTEWILYVEVNDYLCNFHLDQEKRDGTGKIDKSRGDKNKDIFVCTKSLTEVSEKFPDHFFRISRKYLINLMLVNTLIIARKEVIMVNGESLKISSRNIKPYKKALERIAFAG